jgi:hypothetical protein
MPNVRGVLSREIRTRVTDDEAAEWNQLVPPRERAARIRRLLREEMDRIREGRTAA